jgi:hypothetical protein
MKKIITFILITVAFANADFKIIEREILKTVKHLKNCTIYTGEDAYEKALSPEYVKDYSENGRAVYYDCANGYFLYSQHNFKGTFIRGIVCNDGIANYDYIVNCLNAGSYFLVESFPFGNGSSDGNFVKTDNNEIIIQEENFKSTEEIGKSLALRVYRSVSQKIKRLRTKP